MEKIDIPETYRKPTHHPPSTTTEDYDEWRGLPYRPNPDCVVCKGTGFVYPRDGKLVVFSKVMPCSAPDCLVDSIRGTVVAEVARQTFETFQPVRGTTDALKYARALAYGNAKFIWLLIYGPPGNGKSHLCNAIMKVARGRGQDVRMVMAADLFSHLREAIRDNRADELLRRYKDIWLLVIDDYGVEYGSDWEMAKFDELMTSRFATAKPTVLVTNKDIADLPDRVVSRFQDRNMSRVCHNTAPDFRKTKK